MVWLGFSSKMGFCPTSNVRRSSRKPILRILELKPSFSSGLRLIIGFFLHISKLWSLKRILWRSFTIQVSKLTRIHIIIIFPHGMIILYIKLAYFNSHEIIFRTV
jgi:hypothetical protein